MKKSIIQLFFVVICINCSSQAFAQDNYGFSKKVGDADFYPAVRLDYLTNSNIFRLDEDQTESSSFVVSPEFLYVAETGQLLLEAEYRGSYGSSDVSASNFVDHNIRFETEAEFSKRVRAGARLQFLSKHHDLGGQYTRGTADENTDLVTYNNLFLNVFGRYGAFQAKGNVELGLDVRTLAFTSQSEATAGDDLSTIEPYGLFSFRLSPDLRALAELRFGTSSYDDSIQDRNDITALFGVSLAATGKLNGEIKLGSIMSNYDNSAVSDQTELAIRTRLNYAPVDYSTLSLIVNRGIDQFNDNSANSAAVISDLFQLDWTHQWSSRLYHRALLSRSTTNRECPSEDIVVNSASYELNLRFRRWLIFGVGANNTVREATFCDVTDSPSLDYELTRLGVHVRATL